VNLEGKISKTKLTDGDAGEKSDTKNKLTLDICKI
jgi:hypothetical protein